ncbi:MAG: hypothetical protein AB9869_06800 [Verrucomicrobiia bacterium]
MMSSWTNALLPQTRISVMETHGTLDKTTWWAGDPQDREGWGAYLGTDEIMAFWVKALALEKSQILEMPGASSNDHQATRVHRWWTAKDQPKFSFTRFRVVAMSGLAIWPIKIAPPPL